MTANPDCLSRGALIVDLSPTRQISFSHPFLGTFSAKMKKKLGKIAENLQKNAQNPAKNFQKWSKCTFLAIFEHFRQFFANFLGIFCDFYFFIPQALNPLSLWPYPLSGSKFNPPPSHLTLSPPPSHSSRCTRVVPGDWVPHCPFNPKKT